MKPVGYVLYWYRNEKHAKERSEGYAKSFMWADSSAIDHYGKTMFEAYGSKEQTTQQAGTAYWYRVIPLFSDESRHEQEEYQNRMRMISKEGME